jgi:nitrate/nitrite transport system substrate-binding protein
VPAFFFGTEESDAPFGAVYPCFGAAIPPVVYAVRAGNVSSIAKNLYTARAMIMAVLEACRHIDAATNRPAVAKLISGKAYVNAPEDVIEGRFLGHYDNGIGKKWEDPNYMKFFNDGKVNFPYLSDGMWFLTQHKRWGLLKEDPDYLDLAKKVNQIELYSQAAAQLKVSVPKNALRSSRLIDGVVWDGRDPKSYAAGFKIRA